MNIVKCPKCNKHIHKSERCMFCGNTVGFQEVSIEEIHKNVLTDYSHINYLVETKKFEEAIELSYKVLEWMPNSAETFWLRLLAKNKCTTDIELIRNGFDSEGDSDFCNALRFAKGEAVEVYRGIGEIVKKIKNELKNELAKNERKLKSETEILSIKSSIVGEVEARKSKLFELWGELDKIEQSMIEIEMDCKSLAQEHISGLERTAKSASLLKNEIYKLDECTLDSLNSYQVKLGAILKQSDQSKLDLLDIKNKHPWIKDYNDLVVKRDEKEKQIKSELSSLKNYENVVKQTIAKIDTIEKEHNEAVLMVDKYVFHKGFKLIDYSIVVEIFRSMGLDASSYLNSFN